MSLEGETVVISAACTSEVRTSLLARAAAMSSVSSARLRRPATCATLRPARLGESTAERHGRVAPTRHLRILEPVLRPVTENPWG